MSSIRRGSIRDKDGKKILAKFTQVGDVGEFIIRLPDGEEFSGYVPDIKKRFPDCIIMIGD